MAEIHRNYLGVVGHLVQCPSYSLIILKEEVSSSLVPLATRSETPLTTRVNTMSDIPLPQMITALTTRGARVRPRNSVVPKYRSHLRVNSFPSLDLLFLFQYPNLT